MPIRNMFWARGWDRDIHLMRGGVCPSLSDRALFFQRPDGTTDFAATYLAATPDVTLRFRPRFRGTQTNDVFHGQGLTVDTTTGAIIVSLFQPLPKRNFIIEVTATDTTDGSVYTEVVRAHIHESVARLWLTPDRLIVRPDGPAPQPTRYRFTARAEFDDGVVGDLTLHRFTTWSPSSNVGADGRLVIDAGNSPGDDITITATLDSEFGGHSATAVMRIGQPWSSEPNPPKAGIVVGGGWPGTIKPEGVPNVLFLGDGFTAGDSAAFEGITNRFVQHLKTDRLVRPFDLLATSMNFWRTFVPAAATGISVRSEVFTFNRGGTTVARPLDAVTPPRAGQRWNIENLLYEVGLPVPADKAKTNAALRAEWTAQVDVDPGANATDAIINEWKLRAERGFIDEIDSFPGMSYGTPPAAREGDFYSIDLHDDRGGLQSLRAFYRTLESEQGIKLEVDRPVGLLWVVREPGFRFDNTDLVVLVTSFPGGRALNATGYMTVNTVKGSADLPVTPIPGRRAFRLVPGPVPTKVAGECTRTMAHELAHSFGLQDEYTEFARRYQNQADTFEQGANVQTERDVKNGGAAFLGDHIRWRWHRIAKAAVIEGAITDLGGGRFRIPLRLGHGLQFKQGDVVMLRLRPRLLPLPKNPTVLATELEIAAAPVTDAIEVRAAGGGALALAQLTPFVPGSIVYLPAPAPSSVRSDAYKYAEMVALNIRNAITSQNRPLTAVPCVSTGETKLQVPDLTGISIRVCFSHKPKIVGLYEGGVRHSCGIFHPTGTCMMRKSSDENAEFCAVCRYILVDFVDPHKHFSIDLDYAKIYPIK
jgi:hypothetical protein